jgi:predicted dehydrogenase
MHISRRNFIAAAAAGAATAMGATAQEPGAKMKAVIIGDTRQGGYGHSLHKILQYRSDVEVVALADPHEGGRAKMAAEAGVTKTYADYREMLAAEQPQFAVVGPRWTIHHKEYILACAEAGCHGFIEKPLCVDMAEADEILAAIDSRKLKWGIAFNYRMTAQVKHARKLIMEEGLIGEVLEVRARGKEDQRSGGEDLIVLGVHTMDLMRYFLGGPDLCMAHITQGGRPAGPADVREATEPLGPVVGDSVTAMYQFPNGVVGHFDSLKNPGPEWLRFGVTFFGTKGAVTINNNRPIPVIKWLDESIWNGVRGKTWQELPDMPGFTEQDKTDALRYAPCVDDVMNAIATDTRPVCSLHDGAAAHEMIQAAFAAHVAGGKVELPLAQREHPLKAWKA